MRRIELNELDFREMTIICEFIFNHDPNNIRQPGLIKSTKPKDKTAQVLGYSGKTIYNVFSTSTISDKALQSFYTKFSILNEIKNPSTDIISFISRAENLKLKIEFQLTGGSIKHDFEIISFFENTQWYVYERFLESFGRKILKFHRFKDDDKSKLKVTVQTADEGMFEWVGEAYTDSTKEFLVIQTHNSREKNSLPTNYMINLNSKAPSIELCIGHMTFPNRLNHNVVTKTIILEKLGNDIKGIPDEFKIGEPSTKTAIKREYRKFLNSRPMNRLSSPHDELITNARTLKKWHDDNDEAKRDKRNENIKGEYKIRYKRSMFDPEITIDKLVIRENIECDLVAYYIHDVDEGKPQEWRGTVSYSAITRAVFVSLHGPHKKSAESVSTIFLILNMPSGEKDFDVLTGVISGVRDSYDGSIGMLILAVKEPEKSEIKDKQKEEDDKNDEEQKVKDFFDAFNLRSSIIPPAFPVAKFKDLANCLQEGYETTELVEKMIENKKTKVS